ncbi:MAG: DUF945 domain-containing protein [Oscillospiraceae bacterium]|nr:DUF945 domain-containing protein [Oscillospiraceae bacterium]
MKTGISIMEMAAEIVRQNQTKADYVVDTRCLEMESYGADVGLKMLDKNGTDVIEPMDVNRIAHSQIGNYLEIPAAYYNKMLANDPGLLAHNVNEWFRREPKERMVRTLDGSARAFLSNRYRRIDNHEILEVVLPILMKMEGARFESCQITDSRMYVKVVNTRLEKEVSAGDVVQAGVIISNSEVGHGSVSIQPLVMRLVCMNGMIVNDAAAKKNHLGRVQTADENYLLYSDETLAAEDDVFIRKIQDTVKAAVDEARFDKVIDLMREASGEKITAKDIPAVVKLARKDFGIHEDEEAGVLNQFILDSNFTLYGLSNAVTRYSQDVGCYDRATELEKIGYDILTMGRNRWNRLNSQASA